MLYDIDCCKQNTFDMSADENDSSDAAAEEGFFEAMVDNQSDSDNDDEAEAAAEIGLAFDKRKPRSAKKSKAAKPAGPLSSSIHTVHSNLFNYCMY